MTTRLYYSDSYTRAFSARVVERLSSQSRPAVVLDQTYFYPTSGGQPFDRGTINGVTVADVIARESDGVILHVLEAEVSGEAVACEIDWPRRFDHMQTHTGQHILSQAFVRTARAETVSFHLGADNVSIDLALPKLVPADLDRAEVLANEIIQSNVAVRAWFSTDDELGNLPLRRDPKIQGPVRVVAIGDFDFTACGGTHVARTGEIGLIKITGVGKAGKDARVEFLCGGRALRDYHQKNAILTQLAADFSTGVIEVDQAVAKLKAEHQELRRALNAARAQLLDHEAAELLASAPTQNGLRIVPRAWPDRDRAELRGLAERLAKQPGAVALLGTAGSKAHLVFARAADVDKDMAALLKIALAMLGPARGGGSPQIAQGGGVSAEVEAVERALREAERELLSV
jgi:alanyl-tRNA synthetase